MVTVDELGWWCGEHGGGLVGYFVSFDIDYETAEDLAQDVFCGVLGNLGAVRDLDRYVWRSAKNRLLNYFRDRAVLRLVGGYTDTLPAQEPWSVGGDARCACGAFLPVSGVCSRCGGRKT